MGLLSKGLWPNVHPFESQKCCLAQLLSHLPPLMCHDSTGVDANTDTKNFTQKKTSKLQKREQLWILTHL